MPRTAKIERKTGETEVSARARPRRRRGRGRRPASASSTTCSTCSAATAGSACGSRRAATSRPAPTTRSRTSASRSARRSTRRSATAPGSAATATPRCRWTRRSAMCAIDISGRPLCLFEADLPPVVDRRLRRRAAEEFFRAVATNAKLTLHLGTRYGSNAHHLIEACFKAFARALREAVSIDPDEDGVPSTKGTLDAERVAAASRDRPRLRDGEPALGREGARARRRRGRRSPADPERGARRRRPGPARGRRVPEGDGADRASSGSTRLIAERRRGRHARCSASASASSCCSSPRPSSAAPRASACSRARSPGSTRRGLKVPHIGWEPVALERESELTERDRPTGRRSTSSTASRRARPTTATCSAPPSTASAFACAIARPPLYGVQFHPEKSSAAGLRLLAELRRRLRPRSPVGLILYPAIDIRDGRAVRLVQGDYDRETAFDADPLDAARRWVDQGARRCTSSTSTAPATGAPVNIEHVARICAGGRACRCRSAAGCAGRGRRRGARGRRRRGRSSAPRRSPTRRWSRRWSPSTASGSSSRPTRAPARSRSRAGSARRRSRSAELIADLAGRGVRSFVFTPVEVDGTLAGPGARRPARGRRGRRARRTPS